MSNRETISQTVKNEIKTEVMDHVIKQEIKNEIEEVTGKSHGFICPTCKAHFLNDEYFIEHVREHHGDISGDKRNSNRLPSSSESQVVEKFDNTPGDVNVINVMYVPIRVPTKLIF